MSLSALLSFLFIWVVRSFLCNTVWGYPLPRRIQLTVQSLTFKALNGLLCADVPLRNYSLTHSASDAHMILLHNNASAAMIWVLKLVATLRTCRMTQQCDHFFSVSHSIVTLHYFKSYTQLFFLYRSVRFLHLCAGNDMLLLQHATLQFCWSCFKR